MTNAWLDFISTKECDITNICSSPAKGLAVGAAGAGKGTFWSFFLTALLTILLAFIAIATQWFASKPGESYVSDPRRRREIKQEAVRDKHVTEHVILSFSDQQLVTGLAMAITTRYFTNCDVPISAYHYDIVCYLLLCSVVTHLCTIVAINHYFYFWMESSRATWSRFTFLVIRCIGMGTTILLTGLILHNRNQSTFPVKPPSSPAADPAQLLLRPAACFFVGADTVAEMVKDIPKAIGGWNIKNWSHGLLQFVIFAAAVVIGIVVAIAHTLERNFCKKPLGFLTFLRVFVVACGLSVVAWNLWLAWELHGFMHSSGWLTGDAAAVESTITFGQMLSLLLLVYAPITAFNAAAEKYDRGHNLNNGVDSRQAYKMANRGEGYAENGL